MNDILTRIDDRLEETVARLQEFCRQPSIAAQGEGMAEMAELVRRTLEQAVADAERPHLMTQFLQRIDDVELGAKDVALLVGQVVDALRRDEGFVHQHQDA